ncbi:MAG: helix-turn-helix domain-containing protein [Rhodopirellula sp.]|nr:helix-turn-helix domain-containing protein [Rhodopirellula sp.]
MSASETSRNDRGNKLAVTYREAADSIGVCERTIWGLVRAGQLRAFRVGKSVRIPVAELERFVSETTASV